MFFKKIYQTRINRDAISEEKISFNWGNTPISKNTSVLLGEFGIFSNALCGSGNKQIVFYILLRHFYC